MTGVEHYLAAEQHVADAETGLVAVRDVHLRYAHVHALLAVAAAGALASYVRAGDDGDYAPAAWCAGRPLGYMVCAGWWDTRVEGRAGPEEPWAPPRGDRRVRFTAHPAASGPDDPGGD